MKASSSQAELAALLEAVDARVASELARATQRDAEAGPPRTYPPHLEVRTRLTWLALVRTLTKELLRPYRADDATGLRARRLRLEHLFRQTLPWDAAELYQRLIGIVPNDPLARLFRYKLATPTRRVLLRILRQRMQAQGA